MPITVPQTEANLLSYFETGDTPNQDQFEELIRTFFYHYNEAIAVANSARGFLVFDASTAWVSPAGVTKVRARLWGAGGGGGAHLRYGGGSGAYIEKVITLIPNSEYTITVGVGGEGGVFTGPVSDPARRGEDGGDSMIHLGAALIVSAPGGDGGKIAAHDGDNGGLGGVLANTAGSLRSVNGNNSVTTTGGVPVLSVTPGAAQGSPGSNGPLYGGGGGGGADSNNGGPGANGLIILEW